MVLSVANAVTGVTPQDSTDDLRAKADQGDPISQFELGSAYETGLHGLPQDGGEAARWYRLAAEQELVLAQYRLGLLYANGASRFGHAEGVRWLRLAADQGLADAQYNLGLMHADGRGVPKDDVTAHMWLNLAASRATGEGQNQAAENRDMIAERWSSTQRAEAQRLAREWNEAHPRD